MPRTRVLAVSAATVSVSSMLAGLALAATGGGFTWALMAVAPVLGCAAVGALPCVRGHWP